MSERDYTDNNKTLDTTRDYDEPRTMSIEEEDELMAMSAIAKIGNIFVAPTKALQAIRMKPTILIAMLILPILSLAYYLIFWQSYEIQMIQMLEMQFKSMGMELTRDMLEMQLTIMRWTTPIATSIGQYFGALISTLMYFAIGRLMKKDVTFKQTFSMILHAMLIANLIWIVHMLATIIFGESNIMAPITSAASLLPGDMAGSVLAYMLINLDIINIWYLVVLYMGLTIVCQYSKKAAGIVVAITILINLGMTASSALMTGMGGM